MKVGPLTEDGSLSHAETTNPHVRVESTIDEHATTHEGRWTCTIPLELTFVEDATASLSLRRVLAGHPQHERSS